MESISRENLKAEIDQLDPAYLELAYRIIRQFPHLPPVEAGTKDKAPFSDRWRGKFKKSGLSKEELESDPRLAYLAERYGL
ncbi:MAG: hypothetical protein ACLFRG_02195 [Desulfococcaceae bacterium]